MSKSTTTVSATAVREWAVANKSKVPAEAVASAFGTTDKGPRGRLHPSLVKAYETATGNVYAQGTAKAKASSVLVVSYPALDKAGRRRTAKAVWDSAAARVAVGAPSRGRFGKAHMADLVLASEALALAGTPMPTK